MQKIKTLFFSSLIGCGLPLVCFAKPLHTLFQVATISSLTQGVYDGDISYATLEKHGDQGLGTFENLDGEMVAVDGHFYQINASGKLSEVNPKAIVPFAEVTYFHPQQEIVLGDVDSYQQLINSITRKLPNKNVPYAIRIKGDFSFLKLRSLRKQTKPYPKLTVAAKNQAIFNVQNTRGVIVGFWFPQYWAGIGVPGFHLHFVNTQHTLGGHVLDVKFKQAEVELDPMNKVTVQFPHTYSFATAKLAAPEITQSIHQAEGGG